jgi:hypothetical protein
MAFTATSLRASPLAGAGHARRRARPVTIRAEADAAAADAGAASAERVDPRAGPRAKRAENVPGAFWVDSKCIDCDTCR